MPDDAHISEFAKRQRILPHWEEPGATYFITAVLLRPPVVDLTTAVNGHLVVEAMRFYDGEKYWLFDYTVMPDHIHCIMKPTVSRGKAERLDRIWHRLKSYLAHELNRKAGRTGAVWQEETMDHMLRNERDYYEKAAYILDNPRRKGLVSDPVHWPWWGRGLGGTA